MWPVQENVPFLSLFKAKQELLFKESCSQTPVWWLIAEIPANLQPAIAEGPTRWACSFLLPQSLRIPDLAALHLSIEQAVSLLTGGEG